MQAKKTKSKPAIAKWKYLSMKFVSNLIDYNYIQARRAAIDRSNIDNNL